MLNLRFVRTLIAVGCLGLFLGVASAQDYPNKPIHIVTATVGSGGDLLGRLFGQELSGTLGQPLIVDNRVAVVASEVVAKVPPDGYTLLFQGSNLWVIPLLQKANYELRDFAPVTLAMSTPSIIVVHPSLPVKSVKELIALAKSKPGQMNYGSSGPGSTSFVAGELFKSMAGVNIVRVDYKGGDQALTDLLAGQVQVNFPGAGVAIGLVKAGKLRALAITSLQPSALYPGIPTAAATGLPGYQSVQPQGIFIPAKTPTAIIAKLNREFVRVLNKADVKEKLGQAGWEVVANSPDEFAAYIKADVDTTSKLFKELGVKVN